MDWLSRQAKAPPVLQRAHVSKGYLYPLFVIPYQIFIQYVNEFLDAYSCPVPIVKHLVFQAAKQPLTGGIVRVASFLGHGALQPGFLHTADPARPAVMASPVKLIMGCSSSPNCEIAPSGMSFTRAASGFVLIVQYGSIPSKQSTTGER